MQKSLGDLSSRLDHLSELVKNGNTEAITDYLTEVNTAAQNVTDLLKGINVTNITDTIDNVLTKLITTITTAQDVLKKRKPLTSSLYWHQPKMWSAMLSVS